MVVGQIVLAQRFDGDEQVGAHLGERARLDERGHVLGVHRLHAEHARGDVGEVLRGQLDLVRRALELRLGAVDNDGERVDVLRGREERKWNETGG